MKNKNLLIVNCIFCNTDKEIIECGRDLVSSEKAW